MLDGTVPLVDIHCHQYHGLGLVQLLSCDVHEVGTSLAGQFSSPTHEHTRSDLTLNGRYFSIGVHPWYIDKQNIDYAFQFLNTAKAHPKLLAIGECGLDTCIKLPMPLQIDIFTRQIALSECSEKPLIVHCVRAFSEILHLKKRLNPKQAWIIHGFNGKPTLAEQFIKHDCYLSFGAALLRPDSHAGRALQTVPANRIFLETDTAEAPISQIYAAAARIRGIENTILREQIFSNFSTLFLND